jgi:hypothetical protein
MVKFLIMRKIFKEKRFILALAGIALILLLLLASGLRGLEFDKGRPTGFFKTMPTQPVEDAIRQFTSVSVWKQGAFWLLLIVMVILVASLLSPELRKRLVRAFLTFILTVYTLSYLVENNLLDFPEIESAESAAAVAGEGDVGELPPTPEFTPPDLPDWVNFLISLGVALAVIGLAWLLVRWWQRFNRRYQPPLKDLASIARSSLNDLSAGADWADAITNCYVRMSDVVSRKRGLRRQAAMTPAEFSRRLERAGLPSDPVHRLTRLFESVRYGAHKPAQTEINEAVSCLNAILHYCGEEK